MHPLRTGSSITSIDDHLVGIIADESESEQCDLISHDESISSSNTTNTTTSSWSDDNHNHNHNNSTQRYHRISSLNMLNPHHHDTSTAAMRTMTNNSSSFFTLSSNFKVVLSCVLWWMCYFFMGLFGGSVAYMHFPRIIAVDNNTMEEEESQNNYILPDYGYDLIPYYCPMVPHFGNVQSFCMIFLYLTIMASSLYRWNVVRYTHPITGQHIWGTGDGRLILQQLCHLNCLIFLTRTTTVGVTGLPQPNPKCIEHQYDSIPTYKDALQFVVGRGFPPRACGDLIYSGHVGSILMSMVVLHRHGFFKNPIVAIFFGSIALVGIYFTISCRSHYTVDVILAFYFVYFLTDWYMNRSNGNIDGRISRLIRYIEVRPPTDLEFLDDDGCSSSSSNNSNTVLSKKDFNKNQMASTMDDDYAPPSPPTIIGV